MSEHLSELLSLSAFQGNEIAVVEAAGLRTVRTSYASLAERARAFAALLDARGIGRGDRVVLCAPNSANWISVFLGCVQCGAVVVPLDVQSTPEFAQRVASGTAPKLIVAGPNIFGQPVFSIDEVAALPAAPARRVEGLSRQDPLQIIFTSGTTAEPKGVVHSHHNLLASIEPMHREIQKYRRLERLFHPLRFLLTLPFSHVFGQFMGLWIPPLIGAEVHLPNSASPARLTEWIRRETISVLVTVPRLADLMQAYLESEFPHLRGGPDRGGHFLKAWWRYRDVHARLGWKFWAIVCGGATLSAETELYWRRLGYAVIQGYGMTETAALVSVNHPFHMSRGSIGKVLPGREVQIGGDGEILVRGANLATEFWVDGKIQRRAPDEWLATGDLARRDPAGNLYFQGRKKDVIVTAAGMNVHPEDLEAALIEAGAAGACVAGLDLGSGPEPVAALIGGSTEIVARANARLAAHQQIREWQPWPAPDFPRTSTGKVVRRRVAADLAGMRMGASAGDARPSESWLVEAIARITGRPSAEVTPDADLAADLKLDSLGRAQLRALLEDEYGLTLPDGAVEQPRSLGQLEAGLTPRSAPASEQPAARPAAPAASGPPYPYPKYPWRWPRPWVRLAFQQAVMMPLVTWLGKAVVQNHLAQVGRPCVIVANHVTRYDVPLILSALPFHVRRRVAVAMSGEQLRSWRYPEPGKPWIRRWLEFGQYWLVVPLFNAFSLPQQASFRDSFRHAGEAMDRGYHVLIFPEGTLSPDESMAAFRTGVGLLVKELGADVITVRMHGVGELKAAGKHKWRRGQIQIGIAGPHRLDLDQEPGELTREIENLMRQIRPGL